MVEPFCKMPVSVLFRSVRATAPIRLSGDCGGRCAQATIRTAGENPIFEHHELEKRPGGIVVLGGQAHGSRVVRNRRRSNRERSKGKTTRAESPGPRRKKTLSRHCCFWNIPNDGVRSCRSGDFCRTSGALWGTKLPPRTRMGAPMPRRPLAPSAEPDGEAQAQGRQVGRSNENREGFSGFKGRDSGE
jgi:hypothetical protein